MIVEYSKKFEKQLRKAPKKIKIQFRKKLAIFILDKDDVRLNNHRLKGRFGIFRSINVTGDWRVIFRELNGGKLVKFYLISTHSQLYG
jgi:addiction module RelE/StbE family toxin